MMRSYSNHAKPLLGFGRTGVVAAVILFALSLALLMGWDLLTAYIHLLSWLIGADLTLQYVAYVHVWHGLSLKSPAFNLISVIYTVIALRIYPRPVAWWRYAIVIAWGLVHPLYSWYSLVTAPLAVLISGEPMGAATSPLAVWTAVALGELATSLVLLVVTRSWRVALAAAVANAVIVVAVFCIDKGWLAVPFPFASADAALASLWQVLVFASLLVWSVYHRMRVRTESQCQHCGYELAAGTSRTCPECGISLSDTQGGTSPA